MDTILLIEDDPADLVTQALVLRCFGYEVLETANPNDAIRACDDHPGPIQLVLTTNALDTDQFTEVVVRLKRDCPEVCALFISDVPREYLTDKKALSCECAFLKKPFRAEALAGVIGQMLGHRRVTSAA